MRIRIIILAFILVSSCEIFRSTSQKRNEFPKIYFSINSLRINLFKGFYKLSKKEYLRNQNGF